MTATLGAAAAALATVFGAVAIVMQRRNERRQLELTGKSATREDLQLLIQSQVNYIDRQDKKLVAQDERANLQDQRIYDLERALRTTTEALGDVTAKHQDCEERLARLEAGR